jgi:hypothetical protein
MIRTQRSKVRAIKDSTRLKPHAHRNGCLILLHQHFKFSLKELSLPSSWVEKMLIKCNLPRGNKKGSGTGKSTNKNKLDKSSNEAG